MTHCNGCLGSQMVQFDGAEDTNKQTSQLRQWPVQLHLVSPEAPYFQGADLLISADCVAYALADFHSEHLNGKSLAIACPKLDNGQEIYVEKLVKLIDSAQINTLTIMIIQVPCCRGLVNLVQETLRRTQRQVPAKVRVVSIEGEIIADRWL